MFTYSLFRALWSNTAFMQALNTLGRAKWRVNKRVLSVVDNIWASGGRVAGLVDREDVSLFFFFLKMLTVNFIQTIKKISN